MLGRVLKKWFSSEEESGVTDKAFGSIAKFRLGSLVSINPVVFALLDEESLFAKHFSETDFSSMIVNTILSFEFDNMKIYRLYCVNPDCILQMQEEANGTISYMLFMLTQETALQDESEYKDWYSASDSIMKSRAITDESTDKEFIFKKVFGPLEYTELLEADSSHTNRPITLRKAMSLFDRETSDSVEYVLFDAELDNWCVEGFVGINVPAEEVQIS